MKEASGTTPKRPDHRDPGVIASAAKQIADRLHADGMKDFGTADDMAEDIAKHARYGDDGYQIARALEKYAYWDCDFALAEELDSFYGIVSDIVRNLEKQWVETYNIQPSFPIGTRVRLPRGETGVIDRIYEYARYAIAIDGDPTAAAPTLSRRIVNFEDASLIESEAA